MNQPALDLGYVLKPARRAAEPGCGGLRILLSDTPSYHHFDPVRACVTIYAPEDESIHAITLEHPAAAADYRLCAGPCIVEDRRGKHLDLFTFGGELRLEPEEIRTILYIESPAPVLLQPGVHAATALLAQEAEIVLARRCAAWEHDPQGFEALLGQADPLWLYAACLSEITRRFQSFPQNTELAHQFRHLLKAESQAVYDHLPAALRGLSLEDGL